MGLRRFVFQMHLWIGISLGLLFVLIGLSGTGLMLRGLPGIGQKTSDIRVAVAGNPLPLERLIAAARTATRVPQDADTIVILPAKAGDPAMVRFSVPPRRTDGANRLPARAVPRRDIRPDIVIDPASGKILGAFTPGMTPAMQFLHDLHGQLLLGRSGRVIVGWLGVGMTFLGLSGLYLWWPRPGQWKNAFLVSRKAKGLRFHRALHGAVGIWSFAIFVIVSFTGVAIVFPQSVRAGFGFAVAGGAAPPPPAVRGAIRAPAVDIPAGTASLDADAAVARVRRDYPAATIQSVTLPSRPGQAITVTLGTGRGAPVYVDPYRAVLIATPARAQTPLDALMAGLRPLHQGDGLGTIYWALVMMSGFLPALFLVTGTAMWIRKRQRHLPMSAPLPEEASA